MPLQGKKEKGGEIPKMAKRYFTDKNGKPIYQILLTQSEVNSLHEWLDQMDKVPTGLQSFATVIEETQKEVAIA